MRWESKIKIRVNPRNPRQKTHPNNPYTGTFTRDSFRVSSAVRREGLAGLGLHRPGPVSKFV